MRDLTADGSEHLTLDVGKKDFKTLRHILPLRKSFIRGEIDILHVRSRLPAWIVLMAWIYSPKNNRPRLVTTVHGKYSVNFYSRVMTMGEIVIAISRTIEEYIRKNYKSCVPRVRLIPEGIDAKAFPYGHKASEEWVKSWQAHHPKCVGKKILALPGRITRLKGQEDFIESVHQLVRLGEPVHGLIVGDTQKGREDFARELRQKVTAMGLEAHITFTGHRSDLRDVMAASDIVFSLAREPEAFGRVPVEELALGVPTIGYDHGGVGESLRAIYPAGLVPLGDIEAVVARTRDFLRAPPPVPPDQPFTLQRMTDATLAVYQELVDSPR